MKHSNFFYFFIIRPGFSLIEMMIVLAIIAALASIAVPAYSRYTIDAKFSEIFAIAQQYQKTVQESYTTTGAGPTSNTTTTLNTTSVNSVKVSTKSGDTSVSYIAILPQNFYSNWQNTQELVFRAKYDSTTNLVTWVCCQHPTTSTSKILPTAIVPEKCSATCTDAPTY